MWIEISGVSVRITPITGHSSYEECGLKYQSFANLSVDLSHSSYEECGLKLYCLQRLGFKQMSLFVRRMWIEIIISAARFKQPCHSSYEECGLKYLVSHDFNTVVGSHSSYEECGLKSIEGLTEAANETSLFVRRMWIEILSFSSLMSIASVTLRTKNVDWNI